MKEMKKVAKINTKIYDAKMKYELEELLIRNNK